MNELPKTSTIIKKAKAFLFEKTSTRQTFAKNTFWLFLGDIIGRLLKFGLIAFATRMLGVEGWGVFAYSLSFITIFYAFTDIGINTFITRELSKDNKDKYRFLSAGLALKTGVLIFSFLLSFILIPHLSTKIGLSTNMILVIGLLNFSDSLRDFIISVNRALEKMEREAFVKTINSITTVGLGVLLLTLSTNPFSLALAYAVGSILASVVTFFILLPELKKVSWGFSLQEISLIFNFSWPFIATTLFSTAISNIDSIMLGQMKDAHNLGLYAAATRLVQFLAIIPIFFGISIFPIMTKLDNDTIAARRVFEKIMTITLALGIPIAVGGFLLRTELMTTLFGNDYANGGMTLGILLLSILAIFPNYILGNIIYIKGLQKKFIAVTLLGVLGNVILNFYLIPIYGAAGAAFSTFATQFLIMLVNWQRLKDFFEFSIIPKLTNIISAVVIMVAVVLVSNYFNIHFVISIILGGLAYGGILLYTKEPVVQEVLSIIKK